jgi:predicted phosphodiesterase
MANDLKWLMASDIHFPLHDPRKVELFIKVMKWFKPDAVDYLGDIDDADSTGRWSVGARDSRSSVMDERGP